MEAPFTPDCDDPCKHCGGFIIPDDGPEGFCSFLCYRSYEEEIHELRLHELKSDE